MGRVLVLVEFSHRESDSVKELFLVKTVPCSDIVPVLWSCQTFHHLYPAQNFILRDGRSAGDGLSVRCHICKAAYRHLRSLLCRCTVEPLVHLRGHVIVGVQKTDPLAPCCLHTGVPGRAQTAVLLPDEPDAAVPPGVFLHDVPAVVRGAVVHHDDVIRWIKLVNDTATAVDQLGVRQGAVAVYLDAWHKDLPEFLALRTNNGDDRMKAHDVFPAICYPDLFWKMAKEDLNATWYLLCPHEVYKVMGYHLEDYYGEEWEQRYLACIKEPALPKRAVVLKDLVRLILKSAVETGTPFTFNRDLVNRSNPNHHKGIIYCSNLCTEIAQNMSPIELYDDEIVEINGETIVVSKSKPQDFVVCNLASLSLGNLDVNDHEHLRTIIHHVIRALDNVIDLNYYPIPYAKITNQKYRAIGLGVSGYHHMLVKQGIRFESQEHLDFVDQLFEKINYYAIEASSALSKEKGCYSCFMGSDWQTGAYFEKRNYKNAAWQDLQSVVKAQGMRNGYLLAIAPTSSTSIISGTSAGVDPIMNKYFLEEKKGSMIARVAPDLNAKTFWLYKNAHLIDQEWIVKSAGIRARHIDQAQSVNLYITNEFTLRQVLMLFIHAWEYGVKTLYYVRSKSLEVEECESCSS